MGIIGHMLAVQRHYVSYPDLLRIRYAPFDCLIIVGTEDRLIRETNSYLLQQVASPLSRGFLSNAPSTIGIGMSIDQD